MPAGKAVDPLGWGRIVAFLQASVNPQTSFQFELRGESLLVTRANPSDSDARETSCLSMRRTTNFDSTLRYLQFYSARSFGPNDPPQDFGINAMSAVFSPLVRDLCSVQEVSAAGIMTSVTSSKKGPRYRPSYRIEEAVLERILADTLHQNEADMTTTLQG